MRNSITYQLSEKQYSILGALLESKDIYNVLNAGRQSGKTFIMSRLALILGILNPNIKILVVAPYNTQSDTFFFNVMQIESSQDFISKSIQSPYKSITLKNGSIIDFRSADNPKSIRSKSYNYIFLDEFAYFKDGAFNFSIVPTLMASGDKCQLFFSSTPNGVTGMFYEMAHKGMDKKDNPKEHNYSYHYMNYENNPKRNMDIIRAEEIRLPGARFNQEFLGMFQSDGGDVFKDLDKVMILKTFQKVEKNNRYFAGIDWGKVSDKSVLTILDKNRNVVSITEYSGNWAIQAKDMAIVLRHYKPIVYAESNGVGDAGCSHLKPIYPIKEFFTSNTSKKEIVEQLKMDIFTQDISLPTRKLCSELGKQLSNYTYSMTKTGLITYHHRDGEHDDYVDSLGIANHSYIKHNKGFTASFIPNEDSMFYRN